MTVTILFVFGKNARDPHIHRGHDLRDRDRTPTARRPLTEDASASKRNFTRHGNSLGSRGFRRGSAPPRYVAFLAEARELLFLRQVGGGYIFIHRLLREYLVSLWGSKEGFGGLGKYPR